MKFQKLKHLLKSKELRFPLLILSFGLVLSVLVVHLSNPGLLSRVLNPLNLFRLTKYRDVSELNQYSDLKDVFDAQPQATYFNNKKYLIVESCNLNSKSCLDFHRNNNGEDSSYLKFFRDYISGNKATYTWLDYDNESKIDNHNYFYCILEQKPAVLSSFIEDNMESLSQPFNLDKAKSYANSKKVDSSKFEDCIKNKKYNERIVQLTALSSSLGTTISPTFYVFESKFANIKTLDGKQTEKHIYQLLVKIEDISNYEENLKPYLDKIIKSK